MTIFGSLNQLYLRSIESYLLCERICYGVIDAFSTDGNL